MSYLVDTNIFLEILLQQEKSNLCKHFLNQNRGSLYISDFSLHSIGVILFRYQKHESYRQFLEDTLPHVQVISLPGSLYRDISTYAGRYSLDFDDAYQFGIATDLGFPIVTMDKDFTKVKDVIKVEFI